ncbi:MAG: hypothetical protein EBZ62_08245 [Sphingobacteriia bacterium]|nr:hypothetical protein [Sphingobacteriia bacterium]
MVGLSVGSIKLNTNGNIITLQAGANGLLTVDASGVIAPITAGGGATVIVSGTKPVVGGEGNLWLNSETGDLNVYFGNAWAIVGGGGGGSSGGGTATVTAISGQQNTATDFISIPAGTTAQRPANPVSGYIRYNTSSYNIEYYDSFYAQWMTVNRTAVGGGVSFEVEYLVVAGGGAGGGTNSSSSSGGGGGGAGGYLSGNTSMSFSTGFIVTVGAGG